MGEIADRGVLRLLVPYPDRFEAVDLSEEELDSSSPASATRRCPTFHAERRRIPGNRNPQEIQQQQRRRTVNEEDETYAADLSDDDLQALVAGLKGLTVTNDE